MPTVSVVATNRIGFKAHVLSTSARTKSQLLVRKGSRDPDLERVLDENLDVLYYLITKVQLGSLRRSGLGVGKGLWGRPVMIMRDKKRQLLLALAIIVIVGSFLLWISLSPRFYLEEELAILETRAGHLSAQWPGDTFSVWYWDPQRGSVRLWPLG